MESVSKIRRWVLVEGRSIRSVARSTGLSRNTIKTYLKDDSPPSYQRQVPPVRHKLCNGFDLRLQELFEQDMKRPRRERRTAQRLYEQLVLEGYTGSYSPVQRFVRDLKRAGAGSADAFIPLYFAAGDALQFDWSNERVVLGGVEQKIKLAHFRMCHSRKPFVVAYPGEAQEMVLDAFARALEFYGGVPRRVIIDNPKTMVTYVSRSKDRVRRGIDPPDQFLIRLTPSPVPGADEPLCDGTCCLHARCGLGKGSGREPGPVFARPAICSQTRL